MIINIPEQLSLFSGDVRQLELPEEKVSKAFTRLFSTYPLLEQNVIDNKGYVHDFVRVIVDEKFLDPKINIVDCEECGSKLSLIVIASGG